MRRGLIALGLGGLLLSAALAWPALADDEKPKKPKKPKAPKVRHQRPAPGPHGPHAGMNQMLEKAGATKAQLKALRAAMLEHHLAAIDLEGAVKKATLKLHHLHGDDGLADEAALHAAIDALFAARAAMVKHTASGMIAARKLLGETVWGKIKGHFMQHAHASLGKLGIGMGPHPGHGGPPRMGHGPRGAHGDRSRGPGGTRSAPRPGGMHGGMHPMPPHPPMGPHGGRGRMQPPHAPQGPRGARPPMPPRAPRPPQRPDRPTPPRERDV